MNPILYGFWVAFGPNMLLLFYLGPTSSTGAPPFWAVLALFLMPPLGAAYVVLTSKDKVTKHHRTRQGLGQIRGAVIGAASSLILVGCYFYAAEVRNVMGL